MILGAWFWRWYGPRMVEPFRAERVSPASYDVSLGREFIFYRLAGYELPGLRVELHGGRFVAKEGGQALALPNRVYPGDVFLAATEEYFHQPRFVSLSFYLKSSAARDMLEHLHAGWGEHGFHGRYTLEFAAKVQGRVEPGLPIGQMVAHLTLGWHSYADKRPKHYQDQQGVVASRNKRKGWTPWWREEVDCRRWREAHGLPPGPCDERAAFEAVARLIERGWIEGEML